ncbi:MAG: NADH-quinone oxidoreductase subunit N [Actinomycetota bacterium]|nr:MAG: NADH-quinone oxidoreductase subunit N [Actinomycetota bacterium]
MRVELAPIAPELLLVGAAILVLLGGVLPRRPDPLAHLAISLAGVAGAATASVLLWSRGGAAALGGMVAVDRFGVVARLLLLGVAALALVLAHHTLARDGELRPEVPALVLFATAGMTLLAVAADLVTAFVALEVLSLSLYVLTGSSRKLASIEGAMKYFLLGAFSTAFFLYGVAMAYGATGTTSLGGIARALAGRTETPALALVAMALLAVGFGFKVSAAPFHMWTPDAYQGAPTAVTAFMSAGTKVAAFAALLRVLDVALQPLGWDWAPVVAALAAVSVVVGSVLAIAQTDVKRMLAYSSVAHAGFVLIGVTAPGAPGIDAALFYLLAYALMIVGAFGVVALVSQGERGTSLEDYAGLYRRSPALAGLLSVFLLSLAGVPPTAGFIAKVSVFRAAVEAGYGWLALVGVLASVAAAFFYIRLMVFLYMREPAGDREPDPAPLPRLVLAIPAVGTLLLGVLPGLVTDVLGKAAVLRW